jgi:hypothetical protein
MNDIADLHLPFDDETSRAFVRDCVRFYEGIITEEAVRKRYRLSEATWTSLGNNEALIDAIEAEKVRRIRNGDSARERAQKIFAEAPNVLSDILHDDSTSPRHRIESVRELRQIAANGPEAPPAAAAERFVITINLGGDHVEHYDKPLAIGADDTSPRNEIDTTPQGLLTVIAANKRKDDGGGEPI